MGTSTGDSRRAEPNVAPLIDVVLVLLIIFMVVTPMMQKAHRVDLASALNDGPPPPPPPGPSLTLEVARDGELRLGGKDVEPEGLRAAIASALATRTDRTLFLQADSARPYDGIVGLMDVAREAGVARIGIVPSPPPL